jgi:hypothetical protein
VHTESRSQVPCLCSKGEWCELCIDNPWPVKSKNKAREAKLTPEFVWDYITNEAKGKYTTLKLISFGTIALHFFTIFIIIGFAVITVLTTISNNAMSRHCN